MFYVAQYNSTHFYLGLLGQTLLPAGFTGLYSTHAKAHKAKREAERLLRRKGQ